MDSHSVWEHVEGQPLVPGVLAWERLGVGMRCETWLGWSLDLWCPAVVKLPRPHQVAHPRARASLRRETRVLGRTTHPGLPRLHVDGTAQDLPFVVMEHVDGTPLDDDLEDRGALDGASAMALTAALLSALAAVHATGCAHVDVKTENIVVRDGRPVLVDCGSARELGTSQPPGKPLGTLGYTAPEMEACEPISTSMDVFGAGVVLCEALGGIGTITADALPAESVEPGLLALARALTEPDPRERPEISDAMRRLDDLAGPDVLWPRWAQRCVA